MRLQRLDVVAVPLELGLEWLPMLPYGDDDGRLAGPEAVPTETASSGSAS